MKHEVILQWRHFFCPKANLRLDITLKCGQSFRWKLFKPQSFSCKTPVYIGVLRHRLLLLRQDDSNIFYHCANNPDEEGIEEDLSDYFQLKVDLPSLYSEWAKNDQIFEKISQDYPGVRHSYIIFTFSRVGGGWNLTGTSGDLGQKTGTLGGFYTFFDFFFIKMEHIKKL